MSTQVQKILSLQKSEGVLFIPRLMYKYVQYFLLKYVFKKKFVHRTIHGSTMRLNLQDPGISRALFFIGDREREHRYLLEHTLKQTDTILDLGANIGYYALLEHKILQDHGRIVAIEPHPKNFALLQKNVALNNVKNIDVLEGAVATSDGTAPLYLSALSNVHSMIDEHTSKRTGESISVTTYSLQTIQEKFGPIDFIRMDIEGYEQQILQSLLAMKGFTPTVLFEVHANKVDRDLFSEVLTNLYAAGYTCTYLASSALASLKKHKLEIIKSVRTDGTTRHIVKDVPLDILLDIVWDSRCIVLQA